MSGTVGFPDWGRAPNYDSPAVYEKAAGGGASAISGFIDCRHWASVHVTLGMEVQSFEGIYYNISLKWYSEEVASSFHIVGELHFSYVCLEGEPEEFDFLTVVNRGPFLRIEATHLQFASEDELLVRVAMTNRYVPTPMPMRGSPVIAQTGATFAGGGGNTIYPAYTFAGPAQLLAVASKTKMKLIFEYFSFEADEWKEFAAFELTESFVPLLERLLLPIDTWRLVLYNGGEEQSVTVQLTPSITGST